MNHLSRLSLSALAALSLASPALAQDCITPEESEAVVAYLLPDLVRSVATNCRASLGEDSYLRNESDTLAVRLTPLSKQSWRAAKPALERQLNTRLPENQLMLSLGRQLLVEGLAQELDAQSCGVTDRMLAQLDPLPPRNLANIVALAIEAGVNEDPDSDIKVCRAS